MKRNQKSPAQIFQEREFENILKKIVFQSIQGKTPLNYKKALKEVRKLNISIVLETVDTKDMKLKINNHSERFDHSYDKIRNEILSSPLFAEIFAIDPKKQNTSEKLAAKYLGVRLNEVVGDSFKNHPSNVKLFVYDGEIVNKRPNKSIKSVDFYFEIKLNERHLKFYCTHKYTEPFGGGQKLAWDDARSFAKEASKSSLENTYFLTILDGPYYEKFNLISKLNEEFQTEKCIALKVEEVLEFVTRVIS